MDDQRLSISVVGKVVSAPAATLRDVPTRTPYNTVERWITT